MPQQTNMLIVTDGLHVLVSLGNIYTMRGYCRCHCRERVADSVHSSTGNLLEEIHMHADQKWVSCLGGGAFHTTNGVLLVSGNYHVPVRFGLSFLGQYSYTVVGSVSRKQPFSTENLIGLPIQSKHSVFESIGFD